MSMLMTYLVIVFSTTISSTVQNPVVIENTYSGIAFAASNNWTQLYSPDSTRLELINPNHNLEVSIWHEKDISSEIDYLNNQFDIQGIARTGTGYSIMLDGKNALVIPGECNEYHQPVKLIYIAIPAPDGFYIVRLKCPDECYREHRKHLRGILKSIRFPEDEANHSFTV